jgi:hypothetical protein
MNGWTRRAWSLRLAFTVSLCLSIGGSTLRAQEVQTDQERPALTEQQQRQLEELENRFIERVSDALDLDAEQARNLRETLRASREERMDLLRRRAALRRELGRSIAEADPDQARIQGLLDQRAALESRAAQISRDEEARLGEFMNPVQKARFMYLRQRMAQALRDRARQAVQDRPQQRPRRPAAVDRPRATDQTRDRGPSVDTRPAGQHRSPAGTARPRP